MQRRAEVIIFVMTLIVTIGLCFLANSQNNVIVELRKRNIDLEFVVIENNLDLAESRKENANLGADEYYYPVERPVITSGLGLRVSPITGKWSVHYGTDCYSNITMNVYAVQDGDVINHYPAPDGFHKGHPIYGGLIEITHVNGMSRYAHMSETFVKEGQEVKAGDIIGTIGETGMARGKHLHFTYLLDIFGERNGN